MNLDFPHPRQRATMQVRRSNFAALVAVASARQTTSRTVQSMISLAELPQAEMDPLHGRIAYFAKSRLLQAHGVYGAFSPECCKTQENHESAVNPAGSTYRKSDPLNPVLPVDGHEPRGMEA
jgi:hypothetical protein